MKRTRSKLSKYQQSISPVRCAPRRRMNSHDTQEELDEQEKPPPPQKQQQRQQEEKQHKQKYKRNREDYYYDDDDERPLLDSQRPSRGYAYLREDRDNTLLPPQTGMNRYAEVSVRPSPSVIPPRNAMDDNTVGFASPRSARSVTHAFSHLRDSISFAFPQVRGSVHESISPRGSMIVPLSTPPPASNSHSSISSSHSHNLNRSRQQQQQQQQQQLNNRELFYQPKHRNSSDQSFLSTRSAIDYLNGIGSLDEVLSSRESLRSSQLTVSRHSVSKSTLGPLDLSPILKEEKQPRGRKRKISPICRTQHNGVQIDVPASIVNTPIVEERQIGKEALEEFQRSIARCSRLTTLIVGTIFFIAIWAVMAAPLVMRLDGPEDVFLRYYVDTISELQFIYEVPYMSLNENDTRRLYLRVLSETLERLERSTSHLKPEKNPSGQAMYYKRMIRAYQAVQHRSRLYARSRGRSGLHQFLLDPLRDALVYGIMRHGFTRTLRDLIWNPSFSKVWLRLRDAALCLRQDENIPCPTLSYLHEKQQEEQECHEHQHKEEENGESGVSPLHDTMHCSSQFRNTVIRGEEEVRHLKRLMEYVGESCRQSNREYNHL
ncbi:hypothetical protein LSM04_000340 [Trypanosoma melophagium]|uniref:uncharacterized protein n=1 Tax=Trypanosoma melophagium TaxID=715481 RepID=UPI00351A3859|nr:hypothetical protein LSM04_000340 [Trypanosoma melophagium]